MPYNIKMPPKRLIALVKNGSVEKFSKDQVFYALDFKEELYVVKKGYVKRYAVTEENSRVIESIYGPGYFFPLTPVYKQLLKLNLSQEGLTYVYQAMTDVEVQGISSEKLSAATEEDPKIYRDLLYEAGRRLRANINRLASNALKDDYKKVTHQLAYLAEEFGEVKSQDIKTGIKIKVPLTPIDMAEQLNISVEIVDAVMARLEKHGLLVAGKGNKLFLPDVDMLKDGYL
jgi:CRP-like cAMP-binding protein